MSLFCSKWLLIGYLNFWQKPPPPSFMVFQREKPKVTNCSFRSVLTIHPLPKQTHAKLIFSWQIYRILSWRFRDILSTTLESCEWANLFLFKLDIESKFAQKSPSGIWTLTILGLRKQMRCYIVSHLIDQTNLKHIVLLMLVEAVHQFQLPCLPSSLLI